MSDDDYEYEYDSDASDVPMDDDADDSNQDDFEYTDDEEENINDFNVAIENEYYNAKGEKDNDKNEALRKFENVITMEREHEEGDGHRNVQWTFKALKQSMKVRLRYNEFDEAKKCYERLLGCITHPDNEGLSQNAVEKGVNGMLERVAALLFQRKTIDEQTSRDNPQVLAWYVYDSTLVLFHPQNGPCPNERLWFKTNLKYGQLLYENHETSKLHSVISDLLRSSHEYQNNASSSSTSSTNLMEIYALQIQLYSRMKDHKKLRDVYTKAMQIRGGIPHPRTLALIQELGGKMHMASREYESANTAFFQAFKSYDEAGDSARLRCLKYLVIASMLHASSINPFDSQEVRPYKSDPEIVAVTNLVDAFHCNDIHKFERILNKNEGHLMDDEFIREYLADLLRTIRMQVLLEVLRPYKRISIEAVARKLNGIPLSDVENLLVTAILDGKLDARIDQVNGVLVMNFDSVSAIGVIASNNMVTGVRNETGNISVDIENNGSNKSGDDDKNIPIWGENSISVQRFEAIEGLLDQLESLTMAVTAANSTIIGNRLHCTPF